MKIPAGEIPAGISASTEVVGDFSGRLSAAVPHLDTSPQTVAEVVDVVGFAARHGAAVRVRGRGHSLNGSSLPRGGEVLLRTERLCAVRLNTDGTVTVGAGAAVFDVERWLRARGRRLPVMHDGNQPAPSVGGYVGAGGVSPDAAQHGGLWCNTTEVVLVCADGQVQRLSPGDALFPWVFGAMGQLGVVVEATLATVAVPSGPTTPRPLPRTGGLLRPRRPAPVGADVGLYWFNLITGEEHLPRASALLDRLEREHAGSFVYRDRYRYLIADRGVRAPLMQSVPGPLWLVGTWGDAGDSAARPAPAVLAFEEAFARCAAEHGFGRYVQAELNDNESGYRSAFGSVFEEFARLKSALDPGGMFNPGGVFQAHGPAVTYGAVRQPHGTPTVQRIGSAT